MSADAIMVLTFKSTERMLEAGGSSSWRLSRTEARKRKYVICTRNRFDERSEGDEAHGEAFLVATIKDVLQLPCEINRWLIVFGEYAHVQVPDAWTGDRNPVRYTSLAEVGIDPDELTFLPAPEVEALSANDPAAPPLSREALTPIGIAEAKARLALKFEVSPEAVEITIRA